ncbi:MAG: hypothetical protein ACREJC_09865 [Tepidisphaeraceae bacterium]
MIGQPVIARTRAELNAMAFPVEAGQGEAVPWVLFDTQTYTSAVTTTLTFFGAAQADRTLSNLSIGGQLPEPQYFEIHNLGLDVIADGTANVAVTELGIADDIQKLMLVGRPIFNLEIANKNYGNFPLSFLHTSGGVWAAIAAGNTAATGNIQFANNSVPDGGWNWYGGVMIPPKQSFSVVVTFSAAQTLNGGNPPLRFWMSGTLHRVVR